MTATPCPTCRQYVLHLAALGQAIADLRRAATRRHGLHGHLTNHLAVGRRIKTRLAEHRATVHDLGEHLPEHGERGGAA